MEVKIVNINDVIKFKDTDVKVNSVSPFNFENLQMRDVLIDNNVYKLNKTFLIGQTIKSCSPRFLFYICGDNILIGREARFYISIMYKQATDELIIDNQFRKTVPSIVSALQNFKNLRDKNIEKYQHYINNTDNINYTTFLSTKQIAHHIHNELPGIYHIVNSDIKITHAFAYTEMVARNKELFPSINFLDRVTNEECFLKVCNENLTFIKHTLPNIQPELLTRIKSFSAANSTYNKTNKCFLLTIRFKKRAITNQFEFIKSTILLLERKFPESTYLIDGCVNWYISTPTDWGTTDEQLFVNTLKNEIPQCNIHSLIGQDVPQYIKNLENVDFYIAHCHTPQQKVGYLSHAGGIIHGTYSDKPTIPRPNINEIEAHRNTSNKIGVGCTVVHYPANCFTYTSESWEHPAPLQYTANIEECIKFLDSYLG